LQALYTPTASGVNLVWNVGVVDPGKKTRFSMQIFEKFRFFQAISHNKFDFPGKFTKNFDFLGNFTKKFEFPGIIGYLAYSYFWANYSISLQKSPLSNMLPVRNKI